MFFKQFLTLRDYYSVKEWPKWNERRRVPELQRTFQKDQLHIPYKPCCVAAHELKDDSNHVVVLPRSIKIVRIHVM